MRFASIQCSKICGRGSTLKNAGRVTARLPQILLVLRGRFVALRGGDREEGREASEAQEKGRMGC